MKGSGNVTVARPVAGKADAARTEIFGPAGECEAAKAEALVGESNWVIRVAVARSDGVAEARNEKIADRDVGGRAAHRLAWRRQVDRHLGWLAVGHARPHRCAAFGARRSGDSATLRAEAPDACGPRGQVAGELDLDRVVSRV